MSGPMIKRVALAIANAELGTALSWDEMTEVARDRYSAIAIAAIKAMRNPSTKMICSALDQEERDRRGGHTGFGYSGMWNAMVDAALEERENA